MTFFLLGAFLVVAAVVVFVLQPVFTGQEAPMVVLDDEITEAESRKRLSLLALRDVEYDFATGKLDEGDYQSLRGELAKEALTALRDEKTESASIADGPANEEASGGAPAAGTADDIEREIAAYRAALRTGTLCHACGGANPPEARFCATCGAPLESSNDEPTGTSAKS